MKAGVLKAAAVAGGCGLLAVLAWTHLPGRQRTPPSDQQETPTATAPKDDEQPAQPKTRGVAVGIDAVWSQQAWPGTRVDILWVRDPKSPESHPERIVENVLVLTLDGDTDRDGEPANRITVDVTAEQAERLRRAQKVGWLRALARPLGIPDPVGRQDTKD
jgi:Flp pilus assembly protein CpaB